MESLLQSVINDIIFLTAADADFPKNNDDDKNDSVDSADKVNDNTN